MRRLEGKVAIVTGGATGIGEAISKKFAVEGAKVIVNGFPEDPVQDVVNDIRSMGADAAAFIADISHEGNAMECVAFAVATYGRLDILINNAGVFPVMEEIHNYPTDAFEYLIKNNVRTAFLMTKFAIPELRKTNGCIVSAGSESGVKGLPENAPYGGTKGWMHAFMMGVAVEEAKYGVRVNCVLPGPIDTAWNHKETGPVTTRIEKMLVSATPMGRLGTPEEVANVYLFLASDEASFVTGALWAVDGGIIPAKGPIGLEAQSEVKQQPSGELHLEHSREGATDMLRGTQTNLEH
ncbi:MAG TPA: SDR family oxidoreductase [Chitinophagaceae bacterium]|jgi:NAD(P)-dependent dehydrogenase (short-subunit alcohol dehydrogenase family)|nr:SDR family oxidoreductase [Chitinophagaceae bacterium]